MEDKSIYARLYNERLEKHKKAKYKRTDSWEEFCYQYSDKLNEDFPVVARTLRQRILEYLAITQDDKQKFPQEAFLDYNGSVYHYMGGFCYDPSKRSRFSYNWEKYHDGVTSIIDKEGQAILKARYVLGYSLAHVRILLSNSSELKNVCWLPGEALFLKDSGYDIKMTLVGENVSQDYIEWINDIPKYGSKSLVELMEDTFSVLEPIRLRIGLELESLLNEKEAWEDSVRKLLVSHPFHFHDIMKGKAKTFEEKIYSSMLEKFGDCLKEFEENLTKKFATVSSMLRDYALGVDPTKEK